jgi:polyisoprenoid-binding protein YceI
MKKISFYIAVLAVFAACTPKGDNAGAGQKQAVTVTGGDTYLLDTATSFINWAASQPGVTHNGTFKLKDGVFIVKDHALKAGHFTIDLASVKNNNLSEADGKNTLEAHLRSPDFFNVKKYPTATFEITGVAVYVADSTDKAPAMKDATHLISGNLILKDSTKNITFPARVTIDARSLTAKADFNIDRTMWGLNYKGPGNPQDWFISKTVNLRLDLSGTRK